MTDVASGRVTFEASIPNLQTSDSGTPTNYQSSGELDFTSGLGYLSIPDASSSTTQHYCFYFKGRTTDSSDYAINTFNTTFSNHEAINCGEGSNGDETVNNLSDLAGDDSFMGCER